MEIEADAAVDVPTSWVGDAEAAAIVRTLGVVTIRRLLEIADTTGYGGEKRAALAKMPDTNRRLMWRGLIEREGGRLVRHGRIIGAYAVLTPRGQAVVAMIPSVQHRGRR